MRWLLGNLAGIWGLVCCAGWLCISWLFGVTIFNGIDDLWVPFRLVPLWFLVGFGYGTMFIWVGVFTLKVEGMFRNPRSLELKPMMG